MPGSVWRHDSYIRIGFDEVYRAGEYETCGSDGKKQLLIPRQPAHPVSVPMTRRVASAWPACLPLSRKDASGRPIHCSVLSLSDLRDRGHSELALHNSIRPRRHVILAKLAHIEALSRVLLFDKPLNWSRVRAQGLARFIEPIAPRLRRHLPVR